MSELRGQSPSQIEQPSQGRGGWRHELLLRLRQSPRMFPDAFWTLANTVLGMAGTIAVFRVVSLYIPAEDYGKASLALGIVGLLTQLVVGPKLLAHLRLYFQHSHAGGGESYLAVVQFLLLRTAGWMAGAYVVIALAHLVFGRGVYWSLAFPAIMLLVFSAQLTGTFLFLEARRRYRALAAAQSLSKLLQVPVLLLLLWCAVRGANAVLYSQLLAVFCVTGLWGWRLWRGIFRPSDRLDAISSQDVVLTASNDFGWSLYLFSFSGWVLATSDRYFVDFFGTTADVGVYVVNYGLWSIPYMAMNGWLELLIRSRVFERAASGDWAGARRIVLLRLAIVTGLGGIGTVLIFAIGRDLAFMVIGPRYYRHDLMILICLAHFFYATGSAFHIVFVASKRVWIAVRLMVIAGVLNVFFNLLLVPHMGLVGAAWSTLVTYVVLTLISFVSGQRILRELVKPMISTHQS